MNKILEELKDTAVSIIRSSDEGDLYNSDFVKDLLKQLNFEFPIIDIENAKYDIRQRIINYDNAPPNFYFISGKVYESYFVSIPIKNFKNFGKIFATVTNSGFKYSNSTRSLIYEKLSEDTIENNDQNILNLRSEFVIKYNALDEDIKAKENYYKNYIETDFIDYINIETKNEIERRRISKKSRDLLNPFK